MRDWKKWIWPSTVSLGIAGLLTIGLAQGGAAGGGEDKDAKSGRFQAVSSGGTVILLDTATGKTWRAQMGFGGFGPGMPIAPPIGPGMPGMAGLDPVWVPMTKFDKVEDYEKWKRENEAKIAKDRPIFPGFDKVPPPFKDKFIPPFKDKLIPPPVLDKDEQPKKD